jgi:transcriptional regulator with XRE-family HTH domain
MPLYTLEQIGAKARERRKLQGLTQAQAAARIQAHRNEISRIENGRFTGSVLTLAKYLQLLGLRLTVEVARRPTLDELPELFGGDDG